MLKQANLRKQKMMPTALQIETLQRIFLSANTDFEDGPVNP